MAFTVADVLRPEVPHCAEEERDGQQDGEDVTDLHAFLGFAV